MKKRSKSTDSVKVDKAIRALIEVLRSNWRFQQPTKHEKILLMLLEARAEDQGVQFENIVELYEGNVSPDRNATNAIGKLNRQLRQFGLKIERSDQYLLYNIEDE